MSGISTTVQGAPTDEELGKIALAGFDGYWTEDCAGKDSEAWTASAKAVLAAATLARPTFDYSQIEAAARAMAIEVAKNCGSVPELTFPHIYLGLKELLKDAQPVTDHTPLLRMLASRARSFPSFPIGSHITEVFKALGEEPPGSSC